MARRYGHAHCGLITACAVFVAYQAAAPAAHQTEKAAALQLQVEATEPDANGVRRFLVASPYQGSKPSVVRLMQPTQPPAGVPHRFLYVLPVDVGVTSRTSGYSDGLEELRLLDVPNRFNVTLIAPSFHAPPWYGDHVSDPARRQESFIVEHLVPFGDTFTPAGAKPVRWAIGFSKSGFGALALMLRHPDLFEAVALFDAPVQAATASTFGATEIFGSESRFSEYNISKLLSAAKETLMQHPRIWLCGDEGLFTHHMIPLHSQLLEAGIPHLWVRTTKRDHSWDSGWLEAAVTALSTMRRD